MVIQNFSNNYPKRLVKIQNGKNVHSKFIQTFLVQKDWKKFGNLSSAKLLDEIWNG